MFSKNTQQKAYRAIVLALVLGLVAQSAVAPAMAATSTTPEDPCSEVYTVFGVEFKAGGAQECQDKREAQQLVANATLADMYASGLALEDLSKSGRVPIENHLNDSRTYARTIAKTTAVEEFNNGTNKSEIRTKVNESLEDYYATMQKNLLATHNANINQAWYNFKAKEDAGLAPDTLVYSEIKEDETWSYNNYQVEFENQSTRKWYLETKNVTLANGENYTISMIHRIDDGTDSYGYTDPTGTYLSDTTNDNQRYTFGVADPSEFSNISAPSDYNESNSAIVYREYDYELSWNSTETQLSNTKTEANQFVDLLYNNYNQSEGVDISEVLTPNDLATQWNTNYNSTGYYGWIAATLGLSGLDGNVNSSFALNYTPRVNHTDNGNYSLNGSGERDYAFVSGESYNVSGTLMTDWDPNPNESYAFRRSETYDTANASVPVLFIEQVNANRSRVVRLNGTFTIDTLTNVKNGTEINSTNLEEQNQQTWNESSSVEEIRQLVEYRNESVSIYEDNDGSGGGFNPSISLLGAGIGALAALLLALSVLGS